MSATTQNIIGAGTGAATGALAGGVGGAVQGAAASLGMNPISVFLGVGLSMLDAIFGWSAKAFVRAIDQRNKMCSDPATWRPDVCGPTVWHATRCQDGSIAPHGGACPCPIQAIAFPSPDPRSGGCSRANALKDNWLTLALAGTVLIVFVNR